MGKSLTDIFQIWLETFKIEEETDNMKSKKKKESSAKSLHLPNAKENYRQTAKYQLQDYMRKVDISKKKGKEYCDLISSEPYPMRQEHIDYFLKKGYDIYWSVLDLETGPAYYYKAGEAIGQCIKTCRRSRKSKSDDHR